MNNLLFSRLARDNIRKNRNTYLPYILSSIAMISLFFILHGVAMQVQEGGFYGDSAMNSILGLGVSVSGIFSVLFIFYINSFLLKRRKKELGLYSVLGMEKKHIGKILTYEIFYSGAISLIGGVITGIVFSKLMFAFLINVIKLNASLKFNISVKSLLVTIALFALTFLVVTIFNLIKIHISNPIDLIKGGKEGEKEPKGNIVIGLVGLVFLGIGYYLALTIDNILLAFQTFSIAVICVAIATYLLFTSGSISLIKMLRKNKKFYYKRNNFISVSNMIYRMKQNAVGLANIAILSTAVLITLSTTISLYVGMEDIIKTRFPHEVHTSYIYENQDVEKIEDIIMKHAKEKDLEIKDINKVFILRSPGYLYDNKIGIQDINGKYSYKDVYFINLIKLDDYNRSEKKKLTLNEDEVYLNTETNNFNNEIINIYGKEMKVKSEINKPTAINNGEIGSINTINIVVKNMKNLEEIRDYMNEEETEDYSNIIAYEYNFNLNGKKQEKIDFASNLREKLNEDIERVASVESSYLARESFYSIYGSLFFIGIFLGSLFIIATVLIIYYKQISEGYDDRERFKILQKVGMSKEEVGKTIKAQIMIVFFLPLVTAIIHIAVAFPLVTKIMALLNLTNTKLFLIFTIAVILVFAAVYALVYRWTARIYYKIVN